ncbi:hypothetical protein, partial [Wolbachia endosymbiont of Glossina morsitans morsitans]|uniref:hypothetical protein n=1 Tax=Wolbachia endosymbiont of Glossina morsitans morsitans TaxID=1150948 RepID=UPI00056ED458
MVRNKKSRLFKKFTRNGFIKDLVKRIEINFEDVNIVFRVKELPDSFHMEKNQCLQCCCRGRDGYIWQQ